MKQGIHPDYVECTVKCTCGNTFTTRSTKSELRVDICNACHPFFTGQQKFIDTGGRVQLLADKFGSAKDMVAEREAAKKAKRAAAVAEAEAAKKAEREKKAAEKAKRAEEYAKKAEEEAAALPRLLLPPRLKALPKRLLPTPRLRPLSRSRLPQPNSFSPGKKQARTAELFGLFLLPKDKSRQAIAARESRKQAASAEPQKGRPRCRNLPLATGQGRQP